jgi:hypothetical protein
LERSSAVNYWQARQALRQSFFGGDHLQLV